MLIGIASVDQDMLEPWYVLNLEHSLMPGVSGLIAPMETTHLAQMDRIGARWDSGFFCDLDLAIFIFQAKANNFAINCYGADRCVVV